MRDYKKFVFIIISQRKKEKKEKRDASPGNWLAFRNNYSVVYIVYIQHIDKPMFSWWSSSRRDTSVWSCRNISREFHANSLLQLSLSLNSLRNAQGRRHKNRPKYVELTFSIYYNLHRERERGASWREEGGHPSNAAISSRVPTFPRRCSERTKHVWIAYCNCNWKCSTHQKYVSVSWKKIMTRRRWREARFISADGVVVYENVARVSTKRMRPCSSGRVDDVLSRLGCALHLLRCLFIIISRRAAARERERGKPEV